MDKGTKGAHNELIAAAWLLKNGYAVYKNVSPRGPVDLIAVKNSEVTLIDVKTALFYKGKLCTSQLSKGQVASGIKAVIVCEDGNCIFDDKPIPSKRGIEQFSGVCFKCEKSFESGRERKFCTSKCRSSYHNTLKRAKRALNGL